MLSSHSPSIPALRSDLHLLLSIVLASQQIAEWADMDIRRGRDVFDISRYEDDSITRLLLSTAITLRVLDDREKYKLSMFSYSCGTLIKDISTVVDSVSILSLRDACNKIVHAEGVEFNRCETINGTVYIRPLLNLTGVEKKSKWRATIDLVAYVREGLYGTQKLISPSA